MEFRVVAANANVGVNPAQRRLPLPAPTVVVQRVARGIERDIVLLRAVLPPDGASPEGADDTFDLTSLVVETILHLDRDGTTQRVEAEDRIAGKHVETPDRPLRDQVPVHGVAEDFVDAHAVLIDRYALRRAKGWTSLEAAELDLGLKRIDRKISDEDARYPPHQ